MNIEKIKIQNFKCFNLFFELPFNDGLNLIVGDNEAGKSTILEAVHLALSGLMNGKYLKNELSEYIFNRISIEEFIKHPENPPEIIIEIYLRGEGVAIYEGDDNSERKKNVGFYLKIALDEREREMYNDYIKGKDLTTLPIEYYEAAWFTFARESISPRHLLLKSAFIDSTSSKYQNGSDMYISHIIRNHLGIDDKNALSQAHRKLKSAFSDDESVKAVNKIIKAISKKTANDREVRLSVDLSTKNSWESAMLSYVEDIPFHYIGKGYQSIVKTKLALAHKKAEEANIILLEEPENHLSHTKLNQLVKDIEDQSGETKKQVIISTHSSFVANKLGLDRLILLNERKYTSMKELTPETIAFFKKISGYDTLRLILCNAVILCEGDSDELIIQKAYIQKYGKLPIEDSIEVMSVGLSFARYMEIAEKLSKRVAVVTDNDRNAASLKEKYKIYLENKTAAIQVFFDDDDTAYTLEPQLIKSNGWERVNTIIDQKYKNDSTGHRKGESKCKTEEDLVAFMLENKTECALKFFDFNQTFNIPAYIENAIEHTKIKK